MLEITCSETLELLNSDAPPLLIDCRERDEHALVNIEGAVLLPMSEIAARVDELVGREQDRIVVYCHHGMRSAQVVEWLRGQGFESVQNMSGGIDRWAVEIAPEMARY